MTVVAEGKDDSVYKRLVCKNCGTINRYTPGDVVNIHTGRDYSGGSNGADGFRCAECNAWVITRSW